MAAFVLIHGAADVGWYWHLVERELRARGHETTAPDLPCEDGAAGLAEYADTVANAAGHLRGSDLVVVAQSFGGFTAPLVAAWLRASAIVLVAGMIPAAGEKPEDWPANTGLSQAIAEQAARDGGKTGSRDPLVTFYHDVPPDLAEQAVRNGCRPQSDTPGRNPWPLGAWPAVPTRFILCTEDRFFPAGFMRRRAAWHRSRPDRRWPLRGAQPPQGSGRHALRSRRHARRLPRHPALVGTARAPVFTPGRVGEPFGGQCEERPGGR